MRTVVTIVVLLASGCSEQLPKVQPASPTPDRTTAVADMPDTENPIVTLTPKAAAKVQEFQAQMGKQNLRVSVKLQGPTGFMYDLDMVDLGESSDLRGVSNGIPLLIEGRSVPLIKGTVIDWRTNDDGNEGFFFENPNAVDQ